MKPHGPFFIGFDIGGTKCAAVLGYSVNAERPQILSREAFATADTPEPVPCLTRLGRLARSLMADHQLTPLQIEGCGISCGGPLRSESGVVLSPPNLPGWDAVPATQILQDNLGIPVRLQNDASACALAEWRWGAAHGTNTAVFLTFGTGMGAGLIINGRLHSGVDDLAGEVGHWRLADDGPLGFAKHGSFEGYCSGGGLAQLASSYWSRNSGVGNRDIKQLALVARHGDCEAREVFEVCGTKLGQGLALLIDLLNPEVIVLGSIFVRCEDLLRPSMERSLARETLPAALSRCRVEAAALGEQIGDYATLVVAQETI